MKAAVCEEYGKPEVLKLRDLEIPKPRPDEILIETYASTVAAADYRVRSFSVPTLMWIPARIMLGWNRPKRSVLGAELAGIVKEVGSEVEHFQVGDEIIAAALPHFGGYGEYTCLPANQGVAKKPGNLSWSEAASVPIGAITAYQYLQRAGLKFGKKVLIYGASGSVGTYAIQIARHLGGRVTAVSSKSNMELTKSLGAECSLSYDTPGWIKELEKYDIIFITVDKMSFSVANQCLKNGGAYVNVSNPFKSLSMIWSSVISKKEIIVSSDFKVNKVQFDEVLKLLSEGVIRPVIDREYKLEDVVEAHRYADLKHKKGNVVIRIKDK